MFTARKDFDKDTGAKFAKLMLAMNGKDALTATVLKLEGCKKWVPVTREARAGFDDLLKGVLSDKNLMPVRREEMMRRSQVAHVPKRLDLEDAAGPLLRPSPEKKGHLSTSSSTLSGDTPAGLFQGWHRLGSAASDSGPFMHACHLRPVNGS